MQPGAGVAPTDRQHYLGTCTPEFRQSLVQVSDREACDRTGQMLVVAAGGTEHLYRRTVGHGQDGEVPLRMPHSQAEHVVEEPYDRVVVVGTGADPGQAKNF